MLKSAGPADLSIESVLQELATPKPSHVADAPLAGEDREREEKPKDMGLTRTPVTGGLTWAHAATKRPGVIEQAQESPEGREALAEINREFNDEGVYLKVRSKIHDLFWMVRHMPPEEAAKREFAHHAADIARDVVIGRRHYRPIHQIEEAEGVREWLGNYVQSLKDAEARLHERS
jgi:hypothetical protein